MKYIRSHKGKTDIQIRKIVLFCLMKNRTDISDSNIAVFKKNIKAKNINRQVIRRVNMHQGAKFILAGIHNKLEALRLA